MSRLFQTSLALASVFYAAHCLAEDAEPYTALRLPVLGLQVECAAIAENCQVVVLDSRKILHKGSASECEQLLVETLEKRHGLGKPNLQLPTLGGKQYWSDVFYYAGWRIQENSLTGHYRLLNADDARAAWGSFEACRTSLEKRRVTGEIKPQSQRMVVLLHGLFRSKDSFGKMKKTLEINGFQTASLNYPSTRQSISAHADSLEQLMNSLEDVKSVSFVTHSLGGIVARELLARDSEWKKRIRLERLVMTAPPNRGSVAAEILKDWFFYEAVAGESGQELPPEEVAKVPLPSCEFAIIAGGKGDGEGFNPLLQGDDDGTVLVENTKLPGAEGFLLVDSLHSWIMDNDEAISAAVSFLKGGELRVSHE